MRTVMLAMLLVACKGGADQAKKDIAAEEARNAEARRQYDKERAPYTELEGRYEKAARELVAAHSGGKDGDAADIEKAKGRLIAPIEATKNYPDGEQRPVGRLWCGGRCEKAPWIAQDPTKAGVLVIADANIVAAGKWVQEAGVQSLEKELGDAFIHRYEVRAVLVPEDIVVARWTRYGMIPGISDHELMPVRSEEHTADLEAIAAGRAPPVKGRPPKTTLGGVGGYGD